MKVKYLGSKVGGLGVLLPIGVRSRSAVRGSVQINGEAELKDEDAKALVKLAPNEFALVGSKGEAVPQQDPIGEVLPEPKKRGRKPKAE